MSWLVALLCVGVIIGAICVQFLPFGLFGNISWLLLGVAMASFGIWQRKLFVVPLVIAAGLLIGLWRGSPLTITMQSFTQLTGYETTVQAVVIEDPEIDAKNTLSLRLNTKTVEGRVLEGKLWVTISEKGEIKRGDIVTLHGVLAPGFGNFAGSMYRAEVESVQRPMPGDVAGQVRDWFAERIRATIPEPEASLGIGYLLGQRRSLPPELDEALKIVGLTHVVVASGYNLTILVRFARRIFVKISKYLAALSAGGMIAGFMAITGASPSMSRAGLVAGLSLLAWYYGRKFHPLVLLPFAAAITLLVDPSFGWSDLGWQLSFAAFAGVMVLAPLLQSYFFGDKKPGTLRQILGETIAAQLATLPILLVAFGQISNVALLANLLVLPFVPLAMLLTFAAGVLGFGGEVAGWLLSYMIKVVEYFAGLEWAQSQLAFPAWAAWLAYGLMAAAAWWMWRKTHFNLRSANIVE